MHAVRLKPKQRCNDCLILEAELKRMDHKPKMNPIQCINCYLGPVRSVVR